VSAIGPGQNGASSAVATAVLGSALRCVVLAENVNSRGSAPLR